MLHALKDSERLPADSQRVLRMAMAYPAPARRDAVKSPRCNSRYRWAFPTFLSLLWVVTGCYADTVGNIDLSSPDDPVVSDLQVPALTPAVSGRSVQWQLTARVTDRNNDVVGGTAEVSIHEVNGTRSQLPVDLASLTIVASDLRNGERFAAILILDNAPAGEIQLTLSVRDAAGNLGITGIESFTLHLSGRSPPRAATRPEELQGRFIHG